LTFPDKRAAWAWYFARHSLEPSFWLRTPDRENALSDTDWFALNPDREFRLRPQFPGETFAVAPDFVMPVMGWGMWVVVKQIAPGVRVEHSISVDLEIAAEAADFDLVVRAMFELLVINSTGRRRRTPVTSKEVCTLVKRYMREKMN
jgi:hypothetical protein